MNKGENMRLVLESTEPGSPSGFTVDFLYKKQKEKWSFI